jgi:hypothetical protein
MVRKKQLHAGQNHADIRHQLAVLVAIYEKHGKNVDSQQKLQKSSEPSCPTTTPRL